MLLRELAEAINRDIGVVSRWETGDRTPKPEQVAQILTKLQVHGDRYDEIMTLAYGTNESQWVATTLPEQRRQMAAYVDWEQGATRIVEVAPLLIPGLLQTSEYARAIMVDGGVSGDEIALRVTSRTGRREVITKRGPPNCWFYWGKASSTTRSAAAIRCSTSSTISSKWRPGRTSSCVSCPIVVAGIQGWKGHSR